MADWAAELRRPANYATFLRFVLTIVLYAVVLAERRELFLPLFLIAGLTDALDGMIARRWKHASERGAIIDSVADHLFSLSAAVWLFLLMPEAILRERVALAILAAAILLYAIVKLAMTRRFAFLHLWPSRMATAAISIFVLVSVGYAFVPFALYALIFLILFALGYELSTVWARRGAA